MPRRARGALEGEVLQILWAADRALTSSEIRSGFDAAARPALTTVLTVLDRLVDKDVVRREARAGGSLFAAVRSESEETAATMARALRRTGDRESALLRFTGQLDQSDIEALRRVLGGETR